MIDKKRGLEFLKPPPPPPSLSHSITVGGTDYRYLYLIRRNEPNDDLLAVTYSGLKFGSKSAIHSFADHLSNALNIQDDLNGDIPCVVHPGTPRAPNAAYFLSRQIASTLSKHFIGQTVPHISLESPLAARPRLRDGLGTAAHSGRWVATANSPSHSDVMLLLKQHPVIFTDDGVLTGSVIDSYIEHLKGITAKGVDPIALCRLAGGSDNQFEVDVDTRLLRGSGGPMDVLIALLESDLSYVTTRVIYHAFQLAPTQWQDFVDRLSDHTLLTLYLFALNYFGSDCPAMLDHIARVLNHRSDIDLPLVDQLRSVRSNVFYFSIDSLPKHYGAPISESEVGVIASRIRSLIKIDEKSIPVSLVIFDLDHTLLYSESYYSAIRRIGPEVIAKLMATTVDKVRLQLKRLKNDLSEQGLPMRQHDIAQDFGLEWSQLDKAMVKAVKAEDYIEPDGDLADMLHSLRMAGIKTAVLTDSASQKTQDVLIALGIEKSFDAVFTADATGCTKPDLAFFRAALNHFGATAAESVMVGDSRTLDIEPAEPLGMRTVLIRSRDSLLRIPYTLFSKTDALRRLSNFQTDFHGFKMRYFGKENLSRATDWDLVLKAFQRVLSTFWSGAKLDEGDLIEIYIRLAEELGVDREARAEGSNLVSSLNRLISFANRMIKLVHDVSDSSNRVYIGLDGLFWQAMDRGKSLLYSLDGFALSTTEELSALKPFVARLLPEHQSIVYRVMQVLISHAIETANSAAEFESILSKSFEAEVQSAAVQKELAKKLEQYREILQDTEESIKWNYTISDRRAYFDELIDLLSTRNVFSKKVHEIGADFAMFLNEAPLEAGPIKIVDRAIKGTQPLFLKHALQFIKPTIGRRVSVQLFVDPQEDEYDGKEFQFVSRVSMPEELEVLRPILKNREHRIHPLKPVYCINDNSAQLLDGLFTMTLLVVGESRPEIGRIRDRISPKPKDSLIEELGEICVKALTTEITNLLSIGSPRNLDPNAIIIEQVGSTSRQTHVFVETEAKPIADFDFEVLLPSGNAEVIVEILSHLYRSPLGLVSSFRKHGYRLTRVGYTEYASEDHQRYGKYGKVVFLVNASGFEFLLDIVVREWEGPSYNQLFAQQLGQIRDQYGDDAVQRAKAEIRSLKTILMQHSLYRNPVKRTGIPGVGVEQLVIQSSRHGSNPLVLDKPPTVRGAFDWVLRAAGIEKSRNLSMARSWAEAKYEIVVHRLASADGRSGNYLERIIESEWISLVRLAIKY